MTTHTSIVTPPHIVRASQPWKRAKGQRRYFHSFVSDANGIVIERDRNGCPLSATFPDGTTVYREGDSQRRDVRDVRKPTPALFGPTTVGPDYGAEIEAMLPAIGDGGQ